MVTTSLPCLLCSTVVPLEQGDTATLASHLTTSHATSAHLPLLLALHFLSTKEQEEVVGESEPRMVRNRILVRSHRPDSPTSSLGYNTSSSSPSPSSSASIPSTSSPSPLTTSSSSTTPR